MRLVSLQSVKDFLEITHTNNDALIGTIIEYYSKLIETKLNRKLKKQAYTEIFNGGRRFYYLSAFPVDLSQGFTVTIDGSVYTKDSDYWIDVDMGEVEFLIPTPTYKPRIVRFEYTGGYTESTGNEPVINVPDDLKGAIKMQCAYLFRRRKELGVSVISLPGGGGSLTIEKPASWLPEVEEVLKLYRKFPGEI